MCRQLLTTWRTGTWDWCFSVNCPAVCGPVFLVGLVGVGGRVLVVGWSGVVGQVWLVGCGWSRPPSTLVGREDRDHRRVRLAEKIETTLSTPCVALCRVAGWLGILLGGMCIFFFAVYLCTGLLFFWF